MGKTPGRGAASGALLATLLLHGVSCVHAQSTFGGVVGTITDLQKAVVAGAEIKLTEVRTNVIRSTFTTGLGTYEFVNINQGLYRLDVVRDGLAAFATQDFDVAARQTVRIDAELRPADIQQTLLVHDSAPLVNTENPAIASAKSNRELQQLPFVFRAFNTSPIPAIAVMPEVQKGSHKRILSIRQPALPKRGFR